MIDAEDQSSAAGPGPADNGPDDGFRRRFETIYAETYPALLAYARRRTATAADADDVVAEAYTTAWRRRFDLEAIDRSAEYEPLPWLYGIAGNVVRNARRAGGRRLRLVERIRSQPVSVAEDDHGDDVIRAALARLSFDDQEVLRLVAWEGLSHAEAGQAIGCSTNAVGIRMHRARQRLETELADAATGSDGQ